MVNAIIKSNLKDKVTNNKNIARLGRDEKTGELMYTMYNAESDPNGVSYDPPRTMTIRQFNKAITTNVDDKGVMKGKLDTINDVAAKAGNTSLNGTYHSEMKQMHLNQLDDIVKLILIYKELLGKSLVTQTVLLLKICKGLATYRCGYTMIYYQLPDPKMEF